jgi:hypothetical protein
MAIVELIIAILATYRLAHLLPEDEGPLFVFTRIRSFVGTKAMMENDPLGRWANLDSGINCTFCCGLYMAVLTAILSKRGGKVGNIFLLIFAIAGGQSLLQKGEFINLNRLKDLLWAICDWLAESE